MARVVAGSKFLCLKGEFMGRDDLIDRVTQVRQWDVRPFGETQAKKAIIEPILDRLGWDTSNPSEVVLEYSVPSNARVDYALLRGSDPLVLVEAKKPGESLDNDRNVEQILKYAFQKGVPLAVLSNGIEWWFYLPLEQGDWPTRKFYSIDLKTQPVESVCDKLIEFLHRDNVVSGSAVESAKKKRMSAEKHWRTQKALPEVWKAIITQPHQQLIDLLTEETERNCGYKPDESTVRTFIGELIQTAPPSSRFNAAERNGKGKEERVPKSEDAGIRGKPRTSLPREGSRDRATYEAVKEKPMTFDEVFEAVARQFPNDRPEVLRKTTRRRLHGHLRKKFGINICREENGRYFIK